MSTTNSTSTYTFTIPSINFGNNLVEISALSTLIGSTVAESFVLGNHGAAGLAWAATSSFGGLSVIRACISGACPSWLRETLGVRTKLSDMAVGMELDLDSTHKIRNKVDAPLGIICHYGEISADPACENVNRTLPNGRQSRNAVHAFDHTTSTMLSGVQDTTAGSVLRVFTYAEYPFLRRHNTRFQILAVLFSFTKLVEVYLLWGYSGGLLALVTALPWGYFLVAAIFVETQQLLLARQPECLSGCLDVIAGHLPTMDRPGGVRKVILGAAHNPRKSLWWRFLWAMGALVCASSVCLTYIILGQEARDTVFLWTGFQFLWLGIRIFTYHLSDSTDPMARRMLVEQPFTNLPIHMKGRVLDLTLALAKYQTRVHPRGELAYWEESFSSYKLMHLLSVSPKLHYYPLPGKQAVLSSLQVDIAAVVGDTTLSSVAWMSGAKLTSMDLYDSCIVVFAVPVEFRTIAVPAVRVLSGPVSSSDLEMAVPQFVPKGSSNLGFNLVWWYWIPCESGMWLQIKSSEGMRIVGKCEAEVLADAHVTGRLAAGALNISLTHVDTIKDTVKISRKASESLMRLIT